MVRSQLALAQGEITNMRMEKERLNASHLAASQGAQQRLERAESELEAAKREHQAQIARLQSDNQLLAALHRVCSKSLITLGGVIDNLFFLLTGKH